MTDRHVHFKVGDKVRIIHGREVGQSGEIVMILQRRKEAQYVVEYGSGQRAYCMAYDLVLEGT